MTATPATCEVAAQLVTCPLDTVAAGAVVTITVTADVPPGSTAASLTDVARVTSPTADPDPDDNTTGATTDVTRNADLSVTKTVSPASVAPGEPVTYTITVTNNGPSTATAVAIDDTLTDPRLVLISAAVPGGTCTTEATAARCTIASLPPGVGGSAVMTVNARVRPDATAGPVGDTARVSSATPDGGPGLNEAPAQVIVLPAVSELTVAKTADAPSPLIAGLGEVRYTIDVTNDGPSDADPVTVSDVLPAGFSVVSASSDRGDCTLTPAPTGDTVACDVGRLVAPFGLNDGARARITIVARVAADVAAGAYPNVATASAPSAPDTPSPPAPVTVDGLANVSIIKSSPEGSDPDLTPGTIETYRIRVVNDGPSVARDVVVTDTLPAALTAMAWRPPTADCSVAPTVTCDLGDLPPGTTVELELDVLVAPSIPPEVANTATVTSTTDDPNDADNTSTFTVGGATRADLSIRKLPPADSPVAGLNASYILEIINFGPSAAPGLVITDVLPPGTSFVRVFDPTGDPLPPDLCTVAGTPQTVTCDFGQFVDFGPFVGTRLGIEVTLDPTLPDGTVLSNTATITSDAEDGNLGNNTSTALVPVRGGQPARPEAGVRA